MKMESNDQNRNFTISAKVTAQQKAIYSQKAKENNISFSEWVSSILDISTNAYENIDKPIEKMLLLQEENRTKDKIIKRLTLDLENSGFYIKTLEHKNSKQVKAILGLEDTNQHLSTKLQTIISESPIEVVNNNAKIPQLSNALYTVSAISFVCSFLFLGRK